VPTDSGRIAGKDVFKFVAAPAGGNAFHAIADGDLLPAEQGLGGGQEVVTEPVAVKILNDQGAAANPVHFGDDPAAFLLAEMMQE